MANGGSDQSDSEPCFTLPETEVAVDVGFGGAEVGWEGGAEGLADDGVLTGVERRVDGRDERDVRPSLDSFGGMA